MEDVDEDTSLPPGQRGAVETTFPDDEGRRGIASECFDGDGLRSWLVEEAGNASWEHTEARAGLCSPVVSFTVRPMKGSIWASVDKCRCCDMTGLVSGIVLSVVMTEAWLLARCSGSSRLVGGREKVSVGDESGLSSI